MFQSNYNAKKRNCNWFAFADVYFLASVAVFVSAILEAAVKPLRVRSTLNKVQAYITNSPVNSCYFGLALLFNQIHTAYNMKGESTKT